MYRLMFSDLDETLLVNHHVPKMNQEAILKAREQGLKFVPCTGRAFNMIPDILKEIGRIVKDKETSFREQYLRIFNSTYDETRLLEILEKFSIESGKNN